MAPAVVAGKVIRQAVDEQSNEAVIIEDLVKIREEIAFEIGMARGLRTSILALCQVLGVEVDDRRRAALEGMNAAELEALLHHVGAGGRW